MQLSLVPIAAAGAFAGVATVIALAGDVPRDVLEVDGTLDFPLGYRNATAAFFAIALFPALGLAANRDLDWRLRGVAFATATLCMDFVLLCQSRGSIAALAVAVAVYVLMSPDRLRTLSWLALATLPALPVLPAASDLFSASEHGIAGVVPEMHAAGLACALTSLGALVLGTAVARFERHLPGLRSAGAGSNRTVARGVALVAVLGLIGFIATVGNPIDWAGERLDEFRAGGSPDVSGPVGRFTFNAGSNRKELWRVALDDFAEDPLFGEGSGGFEYSWLRKRSVAAVDARDAHSVELELLSELGAPGLLLLVTALGGTTVAILRARRLGPSAGALSAVALAVGAYWLLHTSVDWFWPYPAVTAPVIALLGSACAPGVLALRPRPLRRARRLALVGLAVLALSMVPPFLSERYVNDAYAGWRTDLARAYDDLDRAQELNRLSVVPILAEGAIAREAGDRARALAAFREAAEKRPQEWATHYLLADLERSEDPAMARNEIRVALELDPLGARIRSLAERLGLDPDAEAAAATRD
jgi:O-antigen ligase